MEHIPSLRLIPGLDVWRPADGLETLVAWAASVQRQDGPSLLALSRQNLPRLLDQASSEADIRKGGYVLKDMKDAKAVIIATGSETSIAIQAQSNLALAGIATRVVSMPCTNIFDRQTAQYQKSVIPTELPAVAIEAAQPDFWHKYVGRAGHVIGISTFGESAPAGDLYKHFKITASAVEDSVKTLIAL